MLALDQSQLPPSEVARSQGTELVLPRACWACIKMNNKLMHCTIKKKEKKRKKNLWFTHQGIL